RQKVLIFGNLAAIALAFPVISLLEMGDPVAFMLAVFLGLSVVNGITTEPYRAFVRELFPTSDQYSATSIGYQLASALGAGFTPMFATALVMAGGGSLWLVACLWMAFSAMSLVSLLAARDRSTEDIQELDGPTVAAGSEVTAPAVAPAEGTAVRS